MKNENSKNPERTSNETENWQFWCWQLKTRKSEMDPRLLKKGNENEKMTKIINEKWKQ